MSIRDQRHEMMAEDKKAFNPGCFRSMLGLGTGLVLGALVGTVFGLLLGVGLSMLLGIL
jgi:hypothetical protein